MLLRFDPPAYLPDFAGLPRLAEDWHRAVSRWFDNSIASENQKLPAGAKVAFYNPAKFDPGGPALDQAITWNAFPKELLRRYGRERALIVADALWPLSNYSPSFTGPVFGRTPYRPHTEYCEWRVFRDPATNRIRKVVFTSEPPEYWRALFGGTYDLDGNGSAYTFSGNPDRVLGLYRDMVGPDVQLNDLIAVEDIPGFVRKGEYNPYNKWNTTHGIVHLCAPPNTLTAEVQLGADASVLRQDRRGRLLVEPDALICCAGYGGPDRNSDPTIGGSVNALARMGAYVTLRNPVGLYMDHLDLAGWNAPKSVDLASCVKIARGTASMIERLEVELPAETGFTISDLQIGGEPIRYGGQIAECITVKLIGTAVPANLEAHPIPCTGRCCLDPNYPSELGRFVENNRPTPVGMKPALVEQGAYGSPVQGPSEGPNRRTSATRRPPSAGELSAATATHYRRCRRVP